MAERRTSNERRIDFGMREFIDACLVNENFHYVGFSDTANDVVKYLIYRKFIAGCIKARKVLTGRA